MGLLINLAEDRLHWYQNGDLNDRRSAGGIAIAGPMSRSLAIDAHQPRMMGVHFQAGGAYPFFGPSAHEFCDAHTSLDDLWGGAAGTLHQALIDAPTVGEKFRILLCALHARTSRELERDPLVMLALGAFHASPHTTSVRAVSADLGLSAKRFIAVFSREIGFTPKLYLRVARFQRVLDRVWRAPSVDWAEVAAAHGYYDQSHLIHDFRQFSGLTPTAYFARRGPSRQHVPMPA
jgi:AraC-like DNA-binding protein